MQSFEGLDIKFNNSQDTAGRGTGWVGSHTDITRSLVAFAESRELQIEFMWHTRVVGVAADTGIVTFADVADVGGDTTRQFELVIGADGAGSTVRDALVKVGAVPPPRVHDGGRMWNSALLLDRASTDSSDPRYLAPGWLHVFSEPGRPTLVSSAVNPGDRPLFTTAVHTSSPLTFAAAAEARVWLSKSVPAVNDFVSDDELARFIERPFHNVGRTSIGQALHAGRVVLVGDAAANFPIIGQGCNAGLESAATLVRRIRTSGIGSASLAAYEAEWLPQVEALAELAQNMAYESITPILWIVVGNTLLPGGSYIAKCKDGATPYTEVASRERLVRWGFRFTVLAVAALLWIGVRAALLTFVVHPNP